ncbi:MAG: hypothetical protein IJ215_02905 [Clostridia bacterium]|nr:hypothetical protein [Clostridia bacterium]
MNEKMKNKRLISWAYIWRFLIIVFITVVIEIITSQLGERLLQRFLQNGNQATSNSTMGDVIIYSAKMGILLGVVDAVFFSIIMIFGWKIIHRAVSSKVLIEKQNEKYVLKSVGIVTGVIMLASLCSFLYSPVWNTFGLGNTMTLIEERELLTTNVNGVKDLQDLIRQGISPDADENLLTSLKYFDFDVEHVISIHWRVLILEWIICIFIFVEIIGIMVINYKKMKKLVVNDTIDESGNIIPTQGKISKKYKMIFIIVHICAVAIVVMGLIINYHEKHKYYWIYENGEDRQHIPIVEHSLYHKFSINQDDLATEEEMPLIEDSDSNNEEYDEKWKNWLMLEHDDEWYLNHPVNIGEANKYRYLHEESRIDQEYAESMCEQVEGFMQAVQQYLDNVEDKSLIALEQAFDIQFIHVDNNSYVYILDNRNLITGVGIGVFVDNYTDRNILGVSMWDMDGVMKKIKKEREMSQLEIKLESIEDKLQLIYADIPIEDVIAILGDDYLYDVDYHLKKETYTWYDKTGSYIIFEVNSAKQISWVSFYQKIDEIH